VATIQKVFRAHMVQRLAAASCIQRIARGLIARKVALRRRRIIASMQAMRRGVNVRRKCSKKMNAIRARLIEASRNVQEHMKLGNRTSSALEILLNHKQITLLIQALGHLDITTRYSAKCTARVVAQDGVAIIVELMRNCNRSKPHQELLKYSINVLCNIAMSPFTIPALYRSAAPAGVLLDLMQNFRDSPNIFQKCTGLLTKICKTSDGCKRVQGIADIEKRVKGIMSIIKRKLEMEQKHNKLKGGNKSAASKDMLHASQHMKALMSELSRKGIQAA